MFGVINFRRVRVKLMDDMREQDKMTQQHQDITQDWKFIQNEGFKGIRVHNQTLANNNLLIGPHDHA